MKIKFIKGTAGIGLGYPIGDEADHFNDAEAKELIESGFAVEVIETADKEIVAEIPEAKIETENADKKTDEIETA